MKPVVLTALLLLAAGSARAATVLSAGTVRGAPGSSVELPIVLQSDVPVVALQAELQFEPAVLGLKVLPSGAAGTVVDGELSAAGQMRIVTYNLLNSPFQDGAVVQVQCAIPTSLSGAVTVTLAGAILSTPAGLPVSGVELRAGAVQASGSGNLRIASATISGGRIRLEIGGLSGSGFVVESSGDLRTWTTLDTPSSTGETASYSRAVTPGQPRQFYRVRLP